MSSFESVRKWRENTKRRMVESMGGKCQCCGYDKCHHALEFHHINPDEKEFRLGSVRANPKSWAKIVEELRKCILLCSNCHKEVHAGVTDVPEDYQKFDESFATYREVNKQTPCLVCGTMKYHGYKTCSKSCAAKYGYTRKVDWKSVDLKSELEQKSYCQIGRELGVSDVAVRKRAKRIGLIK